MYLEKIKEKKEERVKKAISYSGEFKRELLKEGISIIGEFKKASPSKGEIVKDFNIESILNYYEKKDIRLYSVLTEEDYFLGKNSYIEFIKKNSRRPVLRKDFIIHPFQIYESKILGGDCILLIVSLIGERLEEFYKIGKSIGLDILVEVHNKEELEQALKIDADIIGINNRNLKSFDTDIRKTEELIKYIPKGKIVVSESGIKSLKDIEYLESLGVNGVLIGEYFMRGYINENKDLWN